MSTVLVTGGYGFIGIHRVRTILQRTPWRIVNVDKLTYAGDPSRLADVDADARYKFVKGGVADSGLVAVLFGEHRPFAVVNFAAESHVDRSILDPSSFLQTNVIGTQTIMEGVRKGAVERFLQVSTDEVYGDLVDGRAASEEAPLRPSSPDAASKAARRDWLYVEDNCEALLAILERGRVGEIYNVGAGQERADLEMVELVCGLVAEHAGCDAANLRAQVFFVKNRPGHDVRYALRTDKIRRELDWAPRTSFDGGLSKAVAWYVGHQDWMNHVVIEEYQR